jgi:DNA-binding MarR family transcriptional regulator
MNPATPSETTSETAAQPDVAKALDVSEYAANPAGEVWALMGRLFFSHGRPRFPMIAQELDLHPGQAMMLRMLAEPRTMSELAIAMQCDNSNITGIVDRLEERGLVERRPAEGDRRVKRIALTRAGSRLRKVLHQRLAEPPEPLTRISDPDLRTLRRILAQAVDA